VFRRALERGNLVVAELEARNVARLDLSEALELTALAALHDRAHGGRLAARWLQRWLEESDRPATVQTAPASPSALPTHWLLRSFATP
jgi:hypothetical protein